MAGDTLFKKVLAAAVAAGAFAGAVACGPDGGQLLGGDQLARTAATTSAATRATAVGTTTRRTTPTARRSPRSLRNSSSRCNRSSIRSAAARATSRARRSARRSGSPAPTSTSRSRRTPASSRPTSTRASSRIAPANHPASCLIDPGNEALLASVTTWLTAEAARARGDPAPRERDGRSVDGQRRPLAGGDGHQRREDHVHRDAAGRPPPLLERDARRSVDDGPPRRLADLRAGPRQRAPRSTTPTSRRRTSPSPLARRAQISPVFYFPNWTPGSKLKIEFQKIETATVQGSDAGSEHDVQGPHGLPEQRGAVDEVELHELPRRRQHERDELDEPERAEQQRLRDGVHASAHAGEPHDLAQSNVLLAPLQQVNSPGEGVRQQHVDWVRADSERG